jgi:hypothetical protein
MHAYNYMKKLLLQLTQGKVAYSRTIPADITDLLLNLFLMQLRWCVGNDALV